MKRKPQHLRYKSHADRGTGVTSTPITSEEQANERAAKAIQQFFQAVLNLPKKKRSKAEPGAKPAKRVRLPSRPNQKRLGDDDNR